MRDIGKHSFRSVLLQPTSQSIFHACLQRVKADLEAFSCNKEAATVTMKSKDFNFFLTVLSLSYMNSYLYIVSPNIS